LANRSAAVGFQTLHHQKIFHNCPVSLRSTGVEVLRAVAHAVVVKKTRILLTSFAGATADAENNEHLLQEVQVPFHSLPVRSQVGRQLSDRYFLANLETNKRNKSSFSECLTLSISRMSR
jgi:hypothetical protein